MYPAELTIPMAQDLTNFGFKGLHSSAEVDEALKQEGTTLLVINSVCGCAAANARPGAKMAALNNAKKPDQMATVFAGVDQEATARAREHLLPYPPSSPAIALFKDGKLVHFLE
ncbi:MAG: BrxA/BrxB family bacilliredoxin, partial [Bacteroidota bacterium]